MEIRWIIIFLLLSIQQNSIAQAGSVRVTVYGGGNVQFVFNTLGNYKNGITLNNWTNIGIDVQDLVPLPDFAGWQLSVSAEDADLDGSLTGSIPANTIPFSNIQVRATPNIGCVNCSFLGSLWVNLVAQPASTVIIDSSPDPLPGGYLTPRAGLTDQFHVSYRCGVLPLGSMLGNPADTYSDNIFFDIAFF